MFVLNNKINIENQSWWIDVVWFCGMIWNHEKLSSFGFLSLTQYFGLNFYEQSSHEAIICSKQEERFLCSSYLTTVRFSLTGMALLTFTQHCSVLTHCFEGEIIYFESIFPLYSLVSDWTLSVYFIFCFQPSSSSHIAFRKTAYWQQTSDAKSETEAKKKICPTLALEKIFLSLQVNLYNNTNVKIQ